MNSVETLKKAIVLFEESFNLECTCRNRGSKGLECPQCDKIIEARNVYRPVIGDVAPFPTRLG